MGCITFFGILLTQQLTTWANKSLHLLLVKSSMYYDEGRTSLVVNGIDNSGEPSLDLLMT